MLEVLERDGGATKGLVASLAVEASDERHTARVVLVARVVETDRPGSLA